MSSIEMSLYAIYRLTLCGQHGLVDSLSLYTLQYLEATPNALNGCYTPPFDIGVHTNNHSNPVWTGLYRVC